MSKNKTDHGSGVATDNAQPDALGELSQTGYVDTPTSKVTSTTESFTV